jgi:hypothetical protein
MTESKKPSYLIRLANEKSAKEEHAHSEYRRKYQRDQNLHKKPFREIVKTLSHPS